MPEGPSIVLLKEQAAGLTGAVILATEGNSKIEHARLVGRRIAELRSWGKLFLIDCGGLSLRVHFLLFGSYRINERKPTPLRLGLRCDQGELNLYGCSVKLLEGDLEPQFDWRADVMSERWDPAAALAKLQARPQTLVCDALLDQEVFAGVGNIIKNEVLFRIGLHPLSRVGAVPQPLLEAMVEQARVYSFDFLRWKKAYELKKHWLAHRKRVCVRCDLPLLSAVTGKLARRSHYCERCQGLWV